MFIRIVAAILFAVPVHSVALARSFATSASSSWALDQDGKSCKLWSKPTAGRTKVILSTRPFADVAELVLFVPANQFRQEGGWLTFGVAGERSSTKKPFTAFPSPDPAVKVLRTNVPVEYLDRAILAYNLELRSSEPGDVAITLALPGLIEITDKRAACEKAVGKRLGIQTAWSTPPKPKAELRSLIRDSDFPQDLVRMGKSGQVIGLLRVSAGGKVLSCKAHELLGDGRFEAALCKVLRGRARFSPARAANGAAIESYYITERIRYDIDE